MTYDKAGKKLNQEHVTKMVRNLYSIFESRRKKNFLKWINDYPGYWMSLCEMNANELTPEYAEEVMNTLDNSNVIELQIMWLYKCREYLNMDGKAVPRRDFK